MELPFELLLRIAEVDNEVYWKMCGAVPQLGRYMLQKRKQKRKQYVKYVVPSVEYIEYPKEGVSESFVLCANDPAIKKVVFERTVDDMLFTRVFYWYYAPLLFDISYFIDGIYIRVFVSLGVNVQFKVFKARKYMFTAELKYMHSKRAIKMCHLIVAGYLSTFGVKLI